MLYYYGNDKDQNLSFYYSKGFKSLLLLSLLIVMGILSDFLQVGNNVIFFISILQTLILYICCPIFAPKSIKML